MWLTVTEDAPKS
jgi:hypothetical protein